jgi:putative peptidoglycan lipid II flippase
MLPHGVVALSISTVVFPSLARLYERRDLQGLRTTFARALKPLLFLSIPAAIALFAFRDAIVQVLLQRGAFDDLSRDLTVDALAYFALGLVAYAVVEVLTRVFYGMHDTRTPVIAGVLTIGFNVVLCALLVEPLDVAGLALSLSLTTAIEGLILIVVLKRRLGTLVPGMGDWLFRALLAAAAMAGVAAVLVEPLTRVTEPDVAPLVVRACFLGFAFALTLGTYLGAAWVVELEEPRQFVARLLPHAAPARRR